MPFRRNDCPLLMVVANPLLCKMPPSAGEPDEVRTHFEQTHGGLARCAIIN